MVGEASGRMQKADCRDEIALPAAMLALLKYGKQRTRNSRKRFLVFFCSLFVKARVVYRLHRLSYTIKENINRYYKSFRIVNDKKTKGILRPLFSHILIS